MPQLGRMTKGEELANKRKTHKHLKRRLSKKEKAEAISMGKYATKRAGGRPVRDSGVVRGENRLFVRDTKGRIKDNQSARRAASIDRHPSRQRTGSDRRG